MQISGMTIFVHLWEGLLVSLSCSEWSPICLTLPHSGIQGAAGKLSDNIRKEFVFNFFLNFINVYQHKVLAFIFNFWNIFSFLLTSSSWLRTTSGLWYRENCWELWCTRWSWGSSCWKKWYHAKPTDLKDAVTFLWFGVGFWGLRPQSLHRLCIDDSKPCKPCSLLLGKACITKSVHLDSFFLFCHAQLLDVGSQGLKRKAKVWSFSWYVSKFKKSTGGFLQTQFLAPDDFPAVHGNSPKVWREQAQPDSFNKWVHRR